VKFRADCSDSFVFLSPLMAIMWAGCFERI